MFRFFVFRCFCRGCVSPHNRVQWSQDPTLTPPRPIHTIDSPPLCVQSAVKKHREAVKYAKLAERLGAVASRIDTVSKMAVRGLELQDLKRKRGEFCLIICHIVRYSARCSI